MAKKTTAKKTATKKAPAKKTAPVEKEAIGAMEEVQPSVEELTEPAINPVPEFPFYRHGSKLVEDNVMGLYYETKVKVMRPNGQKFADVFELVVESKYTCDATEYDEKTTEVLNRALPMHLRNCMKAAVFTVVPQDVKIDELKEDDPLQYAGTIATDKLMETY